MCVCSLRYPACQANAAFYFVICGLSGTTVFFQHCVINSTVFGKRILVKISDLIFSTNYAWNKLNWINPTDALNSNFIGMTTVHVSGSLSVHHQEFWAVHRIWDVICICGDRILPGAGCHPTPGSIRSPQLHIRYQSRCMAKNSWWRAERLPETCRVVIPIKLEFSAPVGFIHFNLLHEIRKRKANWIGHILCRNCLLKHVI